MSTAPVASVPAPSPPARVAAALPEARRVSLADRVARAFPPLACVHGFRYFARRRVDLTNVTELGLEADVRGKRTQRVRLRVDEGRLGVTCSCAAKVLGPSACRHVWAALLEIDRQGLLATLRCTERPLALGTLETRCPRARTTPTPTADEAAASARPRTKAPKTTKAAAAGAPAKDAASSPKASSARPTAARARARTAR
jgi:hypothetical protein